MSDYKFARGVREAFSKGYDRGNYAAAYESIDIKKTLDGALIDMPATWNAKAYEAGIWFGFFSSYEVSEIPLVVRDEACAMFVEWAPVAAECQLVRD